EAAAPPQAAPVRVGPGTAPPERRARPAQPDREDRAAEAKVLVRKGRRHLRRERWAEAALALRDALKIDPLNFEARDLLDVAMRELEKQARFEEAMQLALRYFREGDYASALHRFYRIQQDRPEIKILDTYIANSWFNWGVILMQAGAVDEAVEKFDEVLDIRPRDREASRAREVARRYHGRQRDAAFDSFATTLPLHRIDQR
ncbi:MAG: tetratricopeptide repeat protein, partial [Planctomycetota bacterium]